jgi:poly(hydroxyalkanoate) depolymerase family esterase
MKLNETLLAQLSAATKNLMADGPTAATAAIQQALQGLHGQPGAHGAGMGAAPLRDINPPPAGAARAAVPEPAPTASPHTGLAQDFVADLLGRLGVANPNGAVDVDGQGGILSKLRSQFVAPSFEIPGFTPPPATAAADIVPGAQFLDDSYTNHAGTRAYKLYIPSTYHGQAMPLVVMLHGCTQNPDDFANGTQMNALAEEKQCFVVYPAQTAAANQSKCWNWFSALDQQREQGEPSIISGITRKVIDSYPVLDKQVYVAGLSAGGAMAIIMGTLYPDLYAAVGVHSGLPFASAHDLPSALAAMKGGAGPKGRTRKAPGQARAGIPIIVFHGDRDATVHPRNGDQLLAQGLGTAPDSAATVQKGRVPNGRAYTQTTHRKANGTPLAEHWVIHGAGHAWAGGSGRGTYTDAKGPDASREMMRFFGALA